MKIGITGLQSTGKTTLLNDLMKTPAFKNHTRCDESTRWVKSLGIGINEDGTDDTQLLIIMKHVWNLSRYQNLVTDRTTLDSLVYTHWLFQHGKVSEEILQDARAAFKNTFNQYSAVYYIDPNEFNPENDGVRSLNPDFRDEIADIFEFYVKEDKLEQRKNFHRIKGTREERVQKVLETAW